MKYYTVYDANTDELITHGTAKECAEKMNLTIESFYCAVGRARSGKRKKYTVVEEDVDPRDIDRDYVC